MPYPTGITYKQVANALNRTPAFFPNATTLAEFRPNSLTLHFHKISRAQFAGRVAGQVSIRDRLAMETVAHELMHWSDQISSVWGQKYLIKLFDAYQAMSENREEHLYKVVQLFDERRRILLPRYYQFVEDGQNPHSANKPWRIDCTVGKEFDADGRLNDAAPLIFVNFGDHDLGQRLARQPISVGALLEIKATWAELLAGISAVAAAPEGEDKVEFDLWKRERLEALYHPELTVYTAPVHLFANCVGVTDAFRAYERGSILASVALNLTDELFDVLRHPPSFADIGARQSALIQARNRGYAFAAMAAHASAVKFELATSQWLAEVLRNSGLPGYDNIMKVVFARLDALSRGLPVRNSMDNVRDYLFEVGRNRFLSLAATPFSGDLFNPLGDLAGPMPPMFDCNGELFHIGDQVLNPAWFNAEAMHLAELDLNEFTNNFLQGCRGLELDVA